MKNILTLFTGLVMSIPALHAQWNNIAPDGSDFNKIRFTSTNTAYVTKGNLSGSGAMGLAKTTNAGTTWNAVPFNPVLNVHDFHFIDDNTGFVCADTTGSGFPYTFSVYKTTDGGNTWTMLHTIPGVPFSSKIYFKDALHGVVTETYSNVWSTSDGGVTWNSAGFDYAYFQDITFAGPNVGYISCADGTFSYFGQVLKTTDGGATWNLVFDFGDIPLTYTTCGAIDFVDDNTGYMETLENLYKTTDGGVTWDSLPFSHNNNLYFQDLYFQTHLVGYGCDGMGGIYTTTDGGVTWTTDRAPDTTTFLYSLDIRGTNAYAAGTAGTILRKSGINGMKENNQEQGLNIYPNPSNNGVFYLNVKKTGALKINVYQVTGEHLLTLNEVNTRTLDLSKLANGTYLVQYSVGNEMPEVQKVSILSH